MGGAPHDFVQGIRYCLPTVTVSPANRMSQQFFSPIFSGKHQIHNFHDLGRKTAVFLLKVGIWTITNYSDQLAKFGCLNFRTEKVYFSNVLINHKLIRSKPLGFLLQTIFKPPWTHLIIHGKLLLLKSRGNSRTILNFQRLTMFHNFQTLYRFKPGDHTSPQPYKPPWYKLFLSRKLLLLNPRGNTSVILNFQHLTLMKFSFSRFALSWFHSPNYFIHFNRSRTILFKSPPWHHFIIFGQFIQLKIRGISSVLQLFQNFPMFDRSQPLFLSTSGDFNSSRPIKPPWSHLFLSRKPTLLNSRGTISLIQLHHNIEPLTTARRCLHTTCQQLGAQHSLFIHDDG